MKRLFNQTRKTVRDKDYEGKEYDWDRWEESEESGEAVYQEPKEDGEVYEQQESAGYMDDDRYYEAGIGVGEEDAELSEEEIEGSYWYYRAEEENEAAQYEETAGEIEEESVAADYYEEPVEEIEEEEDSWYEEEDESAQYDEEPIEEIEEESVAAGYYEEPVEEIEIEEDSWYEEEDESAQYDEEPIEEIEEESVAEGYYEEPVEEIEEEEDSWYEEEDESAQYDEEPVEEIEEEGYSWYYESEEPSNQNGQPYDSGVPWQEGVAAYEEDAECIVAPVRNRARHRSERQSTAKRGKAARHMDVMDKVMLVTGAAILVLAVITISVFANARIVQNQVLDFANVGLQLEGIQIIGEKGLVAVANARIAKIADTVPVPTDEPPEDNKDYNEVVYNRQVAVEPSFTSIQKDLKIKFINRNSDKLVPNVPFSVTVVGPDGKNYIWSDDDMDGIIYKKDIEPGTYQVAMEALTDSRYSDYAISTSAQSVEVKKEISYNKVDVANEVKQETEVNVAKEDTKKNETVVESVLEDTVPWVESKVYAVTYQEVEKSTIPDPATLSASGKLTGKNQVELLAQVQTEIPTAEPTPEPSFVKGTVTVEHSVLTGGRIAILTTKAYASGFAEGRTVIYSVQTDNPAVATASVDYEGNIRVFTVAEGKAIITVKANYEEGTEETEASAAIEVTVSGGMELTLDTSSLKTYIRTSVTIHAALAGITVQDPVVTAESSDTNVVMVSVDGTDIAVTGVAEGSAVVTVKYAENGAEISARCDVTVAKSDAQENKTPLKDAEGRQLYVMSGNSYREAVYADYYTAEKFYVKGDAKYTGWQTIGGKIYYFTEDGNHVTGEQVIQGAKYNFAEDGSLITGDGILGIDVSKWNGNIDWNAVKSSGVSYVIIRCGYRGSSEGKLIEDPKFETNIQGASAAGLKVGVYFFSQAIDEVEAVEEASMVLEQIKDHKLSYPVFIDVETSGGRGDRIDQETRTAVCRAFCTTIQNANYAAGIYSNKLWMEGKIDMGSLNSYKVWLAQYAAAPTYAGKYDIWQYKANGSISGISGNVDLNISYLEN